MSRGTRESSASGAAAASASSTAVAPVSAAHRKEARRLLTHANAPFEAMMKLDEEAKGALDRDEVAALALRKRILDAMIEERRRREDDERDELRREIAELKRLLADHGSGSETSMTSRPLIPVKDAETRQ